MRYGPERKYKKYNKQANKIMKQNKSKLKMKNRQKN